MMKILKLLKTLIVRAKLVNPWIIFGIDLFLSVTASFLASRLVNYYTQGIFSDEFQIKFIVFVTLLSVFTIFICKTHKGIIRYSTLTETGRIAISSVLKALLIFVGFNFFFSPLPFGVLLLGSLFDLFFTFALYILFRVAVIVFYHSVSISQGIHTNNMLIYTGDRRSTSLTGALFSNLNAYSIVGYIRIGAKDILRSGIYPEFSVEDFEGFSRLVAKKDVNCLLFVDRRDLDEEQERLVRYCEKLKIRMMLLPSVDEVIEGKRTFRHLPEVKIEDLLGRDEIRINLEEIKSELNNSVVAVTGAAGSIGSELCIQLCSLGVRQLVLIDCAETPMHNIRLELEEKYPCMNICPIIGDIRNYKRIDAIFSQFHPNVVFHAAAYKHVPLMEENPCEAVNTNVTGTRLLADIAVKYGVERFIMISTDKAVNPTNIMGASKRLAEIYVQSLSISISKGLIKGKTKFITTRFGNVLGSNGSVIPRFRSQLMNGGPLTVTHPDIIRYFMTIPEACRLVLEASVMGQGNEIFVFDMGLPVRIADLARRMIELAGLIPDKDIKIVYTGLRPGEKLYEELLATKENTLPTSNIKIFRAHVREYGYDDIAIQINELSDISATYDVMGTVRKMKQIVPEFKSKNSEFELLDNRMKVDSVVEFA